MDFSTAVLGDTSESRSRTKAEARVISSVSITLPFFSTYLWVLCIRNLLPKYWQNGIDMYTAVLIHKDPIVGLGEEYGRDTIDRLCTLISNSGQLEFGSTASTSIGHLSVPMSLVALSLMAS